MDVSGLLDLADTVVGGATGPGLSGGQKRRLSVALQLLKLPSVIFLDEPTSGLDAASSRELLAHLNDLSASNRTVVLTIHQPRLEIFHMFDRLVLLSDGKVAYHGVPDKAYEVFVNALRSRYLQQRLVIPDLEYRNPADVIMDMLGNQKMRQLITDYYQCSDEPKLVSLAVKKARSRERKYSQDWMDGEDGVTPPSRWEQFKFILKGARKAENTQNHLLARVATLEARATKRATPFVMVYLPVIFFAYGIILGTVYLQQDSPFLIMSGFCVYSVASALFMFPALYAYYIQALDIYAFEHADSAGRAYDLVIQPFLRFITMAIVPVVACALILYVLLVHYTRWSWEVFGQLVIVNIALNQAWVALLIWLILTFPKTAFRLSPPLASIMGFTSGFFIPVGQIPWWYRWLTLINPNYYGFSASAFLLLEDFETSCDQAANTTELECYPQSGEYILKRFDFDNINPYYNITILLAITLFYLLLSVFSNWWHHITLSRGMKKVQLIASRLKRAASTDTGSLFSYDSDDDLISYGGDLDDDREDLLASNEHEGEEEEEEEEATTNPLSPIAEKQEETEIEREEVSGVQSPEPEEPKSNHLTPHMWRHSEQYHHGNGSTFPHPISLPEIPTAVSPQPPSPYDKAKGNWMKAVEMTKKQRANSIELDTFTAQSEPPTPEKHVAFRDGFHQRRPSRINSLGEEFSSRRRRKRSVASVYLRDGQIHSVWKPKKSSVVSPTTPKPPPSKFADVVNEVMRQGKLNLRERQRQLFSRVTATQAVLKEQNEELAAVAELTEEEEEEEKENGVRSTGEGVCTATTTKKKWQKLIKTVIDENKDEDKSKKKRNKKRSTVYFHEVVTNKLASMEPTAARGLHSISEQGGISQLPSVSASPKKVRRKTSMARRRQDAATPSGAIPFTEWKNHYYERQRLTRDLKHVKSDYNLKARAYTPYGIPRMSSDNNLSLLPAHRRSSIATPTELEERSKSVSQFRHQNVHRRISSPDGLNYTDQGELSDTSVALDDLLSPLSSRSVSPSVFSDEEERRSKLHSRTPQPTKSHQPLLKLDSEETRILGNPSNMTKRRRGEYRQAHQNPVFSSEESQPDSVRPLNSTSEYGMSHGQKRRPTHVSLSLPGSPRGTPSPRPTTPQSSLTTSSHAMSPSGGHRRVRREGVLPSPANFNERISHVQARHEHSLPHLPEFNEEEESPYHSTSPDMASRQNPHEDLQLSSIPSILNPSTPEPHLAQGDSLRISTPSPPPSAVSPGPPTNILQPPGGRRVSRHTPLHVALDITGTQTTV